MTIRAGTAALLCLLCGCETARTAREASAPMASTFTQSVASHEQRRIWVRSWSDVDLRPWKSFAAPLRFSFAPSRDTWRRPGGSVEPATGGSDDITADGFELLTEFELRDATAIEIDLCGIRLAWDRKTGLINGAVPVSERDGRLAIHVVADEQSLRLLDREDRLIQEDPFARIGDRRELKIAVSGEARLVRCAVYGLRSATPTAEESRLAKEAAQDNRVFYQSDAFTVFGSRVEDTVYGPPAASVPDRGTIVSPTRAIEGFELSLDLHRPPLQGRVIDHQTIWHPNPGIARFPQLETNWPTVDAAYRVALDVLHRCSTDEFINDPNDLGKWQAGFFMGKTFGFGIWMRDSTHIALRAGNLIDPKIARNTLVHITHTGIDNGCDGVLMPIVGLWDYYLVTGDTSAIRETWSKLKELIAKIDAQFDSDRGLVKAAHSTSNDAFAEPESGGFALGTEAYFMLAYQAMAELGAVMNENDDAIAAWCARGELIRETIRKQYWKESAGFFTTGPVGSDGHANDNWESAGQELAIWPRFGIATSAQRRRALDRLPDVAMNTFGVDVFPYRLETDHFRGAGWVVWTAGMAAAANREGRLDLLEHLIGQQVRNTVMNKTFYEVIDMESGRAWRWPGQVWQAAGFLSYFYFGVLGMEYTQEGLTLNAAVPESLEGMRIANFQYRGATHDIEVTGWGTRGEVYLDGEKVEILPANLTGHHTVELRATPTPADRSRVPVKLKTGRLPLRVDGAR